MWHESQEARISKEMFCLIKEKQKQQRTEQNRTEHWC